MFGGVGGMGCFGMVWKGCFNTQLQFLDGWFVFGVTDR